MKTFANYAAQGDFIIIRVNEIPATVKELAPEGNFHVIAHSETGHNHTCLAERVIAYGSADKQVDLYELFLVVKEPTEIVHQRSHDTHETLLVPPGNFMVKRQREYVAEGFRKAQD